MSVIKGKNKEEVIKTLKKLGEIVVVAKAEVIYAFKKPYFPTQTIEQVMEEIKKNPKDYRYYQVGDITITEISESKNDEVKTVPMKKKAYKPFSIMDVLDVLFDINGNVKEETDGWKDCKECELYGECDHRGAYKKDGKWCYEDSKPPKPSLCCEDCIKRNETREYCNLYMCKCLYYKTTDPNSTDNSKTYHPNQSTELIPDPLKSIAKIDKEMEETNWIEKGKGMSENVFGTGSINDQHEFEEKEKWGNKKEKKD